MTLPEKLRKLLKHRRLSQEEVARRLDCSQNLVSRWCRGANKPDAYQVATLARELGVSLDYLMNESDERLGKELEAERKVREAIEVIGWEAAYMRIVGSGGGVEPKLVPPPARPQTKHEAG